MNLEEIIKIAMLFVAAVIAIKNIVNSVCIEVDIKRGMSVKDATEKRKFRLRTWLARRKEQKKESADSCQKSE